MGTYALHRLNVHGLFPPHGSDLAIHLTSPTSTASSGQGSAVQVGLSLTSSQSRLPLAARFAFMLPLP